MKTYAIEKTRHLVFRASAGDTLPESLLAGFAEQGVVCGWLRASGVLRDVELRAFDTTSGAPAQARRLAGPVQVLSVEGSVGFDRGAPSLGLRAVLARETDRGMEVLAGEIVSARVVALEAYVTAFEDLAIGRALDPNANVVLFGDPSDARYRPEESRPTVTLAREESRPAVPAPAPSAPSVSAGWGDAVAASVEADAKPAPRGGQVGGAIPARLVQVRGPVDESAAPEPGDAVEHFAFGRADVVKSDGDRLHLRVHKDGRIREIALEMLKVTPLESSGLNRRFRLDRKL